MEIKLNKAESEILKVMLSQIKIKKRTGKIGITHGMNRFVSTNVILKKDHVKTLDDLARKTGLNNGINKVDN